MLFDVPLVFHRSHPANGHNHCLSFDFTVIVVLNYVARDFFEAIVSGLDDPTKGSPLLNELVLKFLVARVEQFSY